MFACIGCCVFEKEKQYELGMKYKTEFKKELAKAKKVKVTLAEKENGWSPKIGVKYGYQLKYKEELLLLNIYSIAKKELKLAADKNHILAQYHLGELILSAAGIFPIDPKKCVKYLILASQSGNEEAKTLLEQAERKIKRWEKKMNLKVAEAAIRSALVARPRNMLRMSSGSVSV